jgi:hypothetical protein
MIIYIDIDDTICYNPTDDKTNYANSVPIIANITKANSLYNDGHTIIYWTARGSETGIDWRSTTEEQFKMWDVKYHDLKFQKPNYDLFIDDKNLNTKDWT